mmetsp:Transcript_2231/g.6725  ORF Transcript_2231/g.6725 Transcript_2231/m.6725 type:complete len:372 (-) Transcript_2231:103-1218(-)
MHTSLRLLLIGANDEGSPLHKLSSHSDLLHVVWTLVRQAWRHELMAAAMEAQASDGVVAFAHVENVEFPSPRGLNVNMMPFVMGSKRSLPEELHGYWPIIECCVSTLYQSKEGLGAQPPLKRIGYLTVHESEVQEGFTRAPCDSGVIQQLPRWHPWGFGHAMRNGVFEGGIFMASDVSDSCHLYNALVPNELVGQGGDVEHLRGVLREHFAEPPKPRTRWPNDVGEFREHAGCARSHMHLEGDDIFEQRPVRGPISLQAGELVWFTDRTPHESVPLKAGQPRRFFRLVTGGIDTWFAAHSTPNPLGTRPQAKVVDYDKFTGEPAARAEKQPSADANRMRKFSMTRLRAALMQAARSANSAGEAADQSLDVQ